jgi:integrase
VVELVRGHVSEHDIGEREVMFPADLVVPPRRTKPRLTEDELRALGDCEPVNGRVYAHGTLGGYVTAKCRCAGCRQWARDYQRERLRVQRAAATCPARRRWEKSRDPDEPYLDKQLWDRIWARAVTDSGIPFKPTAYQVRHTHASWLIDAGENPKAVMHRLGQADLRTTAIRACARRNRRVSRQAVRRATAPAVTIGRRTAQRRFPSGLCSCPAAQPSI